MTYQTLPAKVRKDPLGPGHLGALKSNAIWLQRLLGAEHVIATGEHNALEVPRVCRRITDGSPATVSPSSSDITGVTRPATGQYTATLAASRFTTDIRAQINVKPETAKPHLGVVELVSATSLKVYTWYLYSALGAGNDWRAANFSFDLALHSAPLAAGAWATTPTDIAGGGPLDDSSTAWNAHVQTSADIWAHLGAAHNTSTGVHNVREVARCAGVVRYNNTVCSVDSGSQRIASATRNSVGYFTVTLSDALTTPLSCFVAPDWQRLGAGGAHAASNVIIANAWEATTSTIAVRTFVFDPAAKTWALWDADFFLAVYGS